MLVDDVQQNQSTRGHWQGYLGQLKSLTSGYNLNLDVNGNYQPQDSGEYVFVYDISNPKVPVEKQSSARPFATGKGRVAKVDEQR